MCWKHFTSVAEALEKRVGVVLWDVLTLSEAVAACVNCCSDVLCVSHVYNCVPCVWRGFYFFIRAEVEVFIAVFLLNVQHIATYPRCSINKWQIGFGCS